MILILLGALSGLVWSGLGSANLGWAPSCTWTRVDGLTHVQRLAGPQQE